MVSAVWFAGTVNLARERSQLVYDFGIAKAGITKSETTERMNIMTGRSDVKRLRWGEIQEVLRVVQNSLNGIYTSLSGLGKYIRIHGHQGGGWRGYRGL